MKGKKLNLKGIKYLVVHSSATPEGKDFTVEDITRWHKARGWITIGYHFVVYRDGSVHEGRSMDLQGAHCVAVNPVSIGICYIGGCEKDGKTPKDTRTEAQKAAIIGLLKRLKERFPNAVVRGHRDFEKTACPSFDAKETYKGI